MSEQLSPGQQVWVDEGFPEPTPAVVDTAMPDGYLVRDPSDRDPSDGRAWWTAAEHVRPREEGASR